MTAEALLANLRERGVILTIAAGDRLRVEAPRGMMTAELRAALAGHKPQIIEQLRRQAALYEQLTADIGTPANIEALRWVTHHHDASVLTELLALDGECARLAAANAAEDTYRAAVERLLKRVREVRRIYREAVRER